MRSQRCPIIRLNVPVLLMGLVFGTLLYLYLFSATVDIDITPTVVPIPDDHLKGFVINTPGCKIPYFQPISDQVKSFIYTPDHEKCNKGVPALYESDLTSIRLINSSLSAYNITDVEELKCCYNVFWRLDPKGDQKDNKVALSEECYNITDRAEIHYDFVRVTCKREGKVIYEDMFSFVPVNKLGPRPDRQNPTPPNVLLYGMDAMSRLNLHRQLKKTVEYIESIGAIELLGYNKVGDNTFPNLIPILTGLNESELKDTCWPENDSHFDNCSFVWEDYKHQGYVTAFGEDAAYMGLFEYDRHGFLEQPTDYDYSHFSKYAEGRIGNVGICESSRFVYKDFQEYVKKFVVTMTKNEFPFFGFFWGVSLSHDVLNLPSIGDEDYYNFFRYFKDGGFLDNTIMIFLSDHGIRWGGIRETYQGRMEERLPFVYILLPDWFKSIYPERVKNLRKNTKRLTTPFDLHETLVELLNLSSINEVVNTDNKRGISLFGKIGTERTCDDAGIVTHWCTCQKSVDISTNATTVVQAATYAVAHINRQLIGYAQCANLTLTDIRNARLMGHDESHIPGKNKFQDYMITFRTTPGDATFEATVRFESDDKITGVVGSISRLNLYGDQSLCINDFHLKLYCYCKDFL